MTKHDSSGDFLVSVLAQQRELHELENQDLSQQERDSLWQQRVRSLTSALILGSSPTNPAMPSPPNKSTLGPSPMGRSHSIAVGEPTQMADRSPSLPGHITMSRKRSAPGATPATPIDISRPMSSRESLIPVDPLGDYTTGTAPKLQRTASGRQPIQHLRLQRPHLPPGLDHTPGPLSAASSNQATPYTQSPITSCDYTPPGSARSASFASFQRPQQTMAHSMDRSDSIAHPIYHQMTHMNISNQDPRYSGSLPMQHHQLASQQPIPETHELDPTNMTFKHSGAATSPPIAIPRHSHQRFIRRSSNSASRPHLLATIGPQPYMIDDKKTSPTRPLAPRPSPDSLASRSISSSPMGYSTYTQQARPIKVEGMEKYRIPRLERTRVEKQKLFCDQCNKQADGFRGAHELQRHKDAQHARVRKVWVCVDGSKDADVLSTCKHCRTMKTYPAYYNAAAHLRRMHFKPKPEIAQKGKVNRAGSGGGDDPPIEILKKYWMKQVVEEDGKIKDEADDQEEGVEEEPLSEEGDRKEEIFDAVHELDNEATEAAERAIPFLSSTIDTIGSYVDVSPGAIHDFGDFDYDCLGSTLLTNDDSTDDDHHHLAVPHTNGLGRVSDIQHGLCASLSSDGNNLLDTTVSFTDDLDFSELFPAVSEFFPST